MDIDRRQFLKSLSIGIGSILAFKNVFSFKQKIDKYSGGTTSCSSTTNSYPTSTAENLLFNGSLKRYNHINISGKSFYSYYYRKRKYSR